MNTNFKTKLLLKLANKKANKGFTLIELLVVTIIVGVLAAVALPNLLGQVGKARETSAKNSVGAINRAQQAYHVEKQTFVDALDTNQLKEENPLGVTITSPDFEFAVVGNDTDATVVTTNTEYLKDGTRAYGGVVNFTDGAYTAGICQTDVQKETIDAPSANPANDPAVACGNGNTEIK